ncbi:uncharacterized protein KY384_004324 [Bacidia gigantensis]|uniref:uncharacterized protein n=1 Tax=Bacidia gigantensis TaxID=2732470 RepID=UPI001D038AD4|nr:uncharacterized protein KY384_004324 [Bacidia gigantensis]KAG8530967.1 hypothetical protein KY384_004324 [Bacidia gigantensis]
MSEDGNSASQHVEAPILDETSNRPEVSSDAASPVNRNVHNLRLDTNQEEPSLKSETSSIVPTSARLSIATTHHAINLESSSENVGAMLDSILANPGWNVGRERRNSMFSMRSLQPTLPPYEEYRGHVAGQAGEAGPSNLRQEAGMNRVTDQKRPVSPDDHEREVGNMSRENETLPSIDADPEVSLTAHYSRVVRTLDERYTDELERRRQEIERLQSTHTSQLAQMRNDVDAVYRIELRKRSQETERVKEEFASRAEELVRDALKREEGSRNLVSQVNFEAEQQMQELREQHMQELQRERNAVEDVWERRWRERMNLLEEERTRSIRKRDEKWLSFIQERHPQAVDAAKSMLWELAENNK